TFPSFLPGGRTVVFNLARGLPNTWEIAAVSLDDRVVRPLGITGLNPRYVASGHLLFGRLDGTLAAVPFDARRLRVTGPAVPVIDSLVVRAGGSTEIAVASNGTLVYLRGV